MSTKVAADNRGSNNDIEVVVREYDEEKDKWRVEKMESECEVVGGGQSHQKERRKTSSLVTDLLGDPICRIRNFSLHVMLVAEWGKEREIVGAIRGCIKYVTIKGNSDFVKVANILGLRVSPAHRRLGVGMRLVQELEEWCKRNGAEYGYMATSSTNLPSINLFIKKCQYVKFHTPTVLVQPVHAHYKPTSAGISIIELPPNLAEPIYCRVFADSDFFTKDIDEILRNKLNLGTFMALPKKSLPMWDQKLGVLPPDFAILSIWNTKDVWKLQVKGVSAFKYACCTGIRTLDSWMPWLNIPSIPNVFEKFGIYFLYGLYMRGKNGSHLMKSLCTFAHNMARDDNGCGAVVAEVGPTDPVRMAIPHWRKFSWSEDQWCIKHLRDAKNEDEIRATNGELDWIIKSQSPSPLLFVDPRDI